MRALYYSNDNSIKEDELACIISLNEYEVSRYTRENIDKMWSDEITDITLGIINLQPPISDGIEIGYKLKEKYGEMKIVYLVEQSRCESIKGFFNDAQVNTSKIPLPEEKNTNANIEMCKGFIKIRHRDKNRLINIKNIYFVECYNKTLVIKGSFGETKVRCTLKEIENLLPNNFVKCNKSIVANMDFIHYWDKEKVVMDNRTHIYISRPRRKEVEDIIANYIKIK